jgi:general secretion pathway protein C
MDRQIWIRRLPWLVNIALLLLLADAVTRLTWQWLAQEDTHKAPSRQQASSLPVVKAVNLAQQVSRYHLFGKAEVVSQKGTPTVAPETKLNLVLRGVISSDVPADAIAIIATRGGTNEKGYSLGDRLPGGAELKEIYQDRVILKHRGRLETLTLLRKLLSDKQLQIR